MHSRTRRTGFSLLEMVLAISIGMLLLLALYFTLNTYVRQVEVGRETLNDATAARYILARITNDIVNQVGPAAPPPVITDPDTGEQLETAVVPFNVGVRGGANTLVLSVYRVQPPGATNAKSTEPSTTSDLRRIAYWMVEAGSESAALARHEIKQATSGDIDMQPSDLPEQKKYIIASEVKEITFEYYDGTSWLPSWDGSFVPEGLPIGPPAAIRVSVTLRRGPNRTPNATETPTDTGNTYQQVIALPTANTFIQQTEP